ncbi:late embryogenesis abundant protein 46-like [Sesamum indicum]|uniref:Late embryogenesis abundant protein 46-like n=1 Tax=Sesamum indicum TaxID=4182 RepID=A0A6I9SXS3_SESIN|nr:late embryogenesis abundant protein 46-like [Sesamum indicum]
MQSMKETVSNVTASAKSGVAKTKATIQEKVDKMGAHSPTEKAMATERKEQRIFQADLNKVEAVEENATATHAATAADDHSHPATGGTDHPATSR